MPPAEPIAAPAESPLAHVLNPRSVAVVGASADPRSFGGFVLGNLVRFGYAGDIHPVSRSSDRIEGRGCVRTVDELPEGVDLAVIAIPEAGVLEAIEALGRRRARAAVLFASGYAESGDEGRARQQVLAETAARAGIALFGPNCMGFTNFADAVPITFEPLQSLPRPDGPGIGVVAQSGAMAANLRDALTGRGLPVTAIVSTGNEAGLCVEDVVEHFLADPGCALVAVYAEQIRRPSRFLALARRARAAGKPVVLLMPGRSARALRAAQSHTGALAGDHASAMVALRREAVVTVGALDELFDACAILLRCPVPPPGGTAFVTGSGAMKNVALDFCEDIGLELPPLAPATVARLTALLPAYAVAENPLDYTTVSVRQPGLIGEVLGTMLADDAVSSLVLAIPVGPVQAQRDKAEHVVPSLARAAKPAVLVLTGDAGPIEPFLADAVRASGVPWFRSLDRALRALAKVAEYGESLRRAERADRAAEVPAVPIGAPAPAGGAYAEHVGKAWLARAGVAVPEGELAKDVGSAVRIAARIGYPVVLKIQSPELTHKSDVGGVVVGLADEAALRDGWRRLVDTVASHRPGLVADGVLVERMGGRGVELVVGGKRDPDWGPMTLVGLGGVWIEALRDVRTLPADLAPQDVHVEIGRLKGAALLRGLRGSPPADVASVADVVVRIGAQLRANPGIVEIDVNPLVAGPTGAVALDALLVVAREAR